VNAILFDTLRLSRTLREKGHFSAEQAEALAEALGEAVHGDLSTKADLANLAAKADLANLATKADLANLATKAELANLEARFDAKLAELKAEILKWVVGAIGFQTVLILGALVSLVRIFAK